MSTLLSINNLHVSTADREILKGINLSIKPGEVHVIMGPNGAGKSTLAGTILSNPLYTKTHGSITLDGKDITNDSTDTIARAGVFMSFQTPEEIEGVTVSNFIRTIKQSISGKSIFLPELNKELEAHCKTLHINKNLLGRDLNVGFSGGEKKKIEILQLLSLNPKLAILDETDSGLDVDAIRTVSNGIGAYSNSSNGVLVITHSTKILRGLNVTHVHVLVDGVIVASGDSSLADEIDRNGYNKYLKSKEIV